MSWHTYAMAYVEIGGQLAGRFSLTVLWTLEARIKSSGLVAVTFYLLSLLDCPVVIHVLFVGYY